MPSCRARPVGRLVIAAALLGLAFPLSAQWLLTVSVPNPYPSAAISDWEHTPGIVNTGIAYQGQSARTVRLVSRLVTTEHGNLAEGTSGDIAFSGRQTERRDNRDFWNYRDLHYNSQYKEQVIRTGQLLEGSYTLYVKLVDARSGQELAPEQSARFWIVALNPPELLAPADQDTVRVQTPTFTWMPVSARPGLTVQYTLKLCEILSGQLPQQAINNPARFTTTLTNQTTFTYSGTPLVVGKSYAWRVTANPGGASQVFSFVYRWQLQSPPVEPIVVTTSISQCHSPYITDYFTEPGVLRVQLRNTTSQTYQVRLLMHLWGRHFAGGQGMRGGEQGPRQARYDTISMASDSMFQPAQTITVPAGATVDVPRSYFQQFLNCDSTVALACSLRWESLPSPGHFETLATWPRNVASFFRHLEFSGIAESTVIRGTGLPNARYHLSFRVLGQLTGAPLSAPDPAGCDTLEVSPFDPPIVVLPPNRDTLEVVSPWHVDFGWTRPIGVSVGCTLGYRVRVVRLPSDSEDVEQAMTRLPAVWDTIVRNATSATWQSSDSSRLIRGKWYAVQVQVFDSRRAGGFARQGRSQAVMFRYGVPPPPPVFRPPPTVVTGDLRYHFKDAPEGRNGPVKSATVRLVQWLVIEELVRGGGGRQHLFPPDPVCSGDFPGSDSVLAYAQTDADGRFTFTMPLLRETLGVVSLCTSVTYHDGEHYPHTLTGRLLRVARVMFEPSSYYLSPDNNLTFRARETTEVGTLVSNVRSWRCSVLVKTSTAEGQVKGSNAPLDNIVVYLVAKNLRPSEWPVLDATPDPGQYDSTSIYITSWERRARVAAKATTDQDGWAHFTDLVFGGTEQTHQPYYWMFASTGESRDYTYTDRFPSKFRTPRGDMNLVPPDWLAAGCARFNSEYTPPVAEDSIVMDPNYPEVKGEVYGKRGDEYPFPLEADVTLYRTDDEEGRYDRTQHLADNPGSFRFPSVTTAHAVGLKVTCPGFLSAHRSVNARNTLKMGQREDVGRIVLEPGAIVKGEVVDEDGGGVESWVTFKDGITYTAAVYMRPGGESVGPACFRGRVEYDTARRCTIVVNPKNEFFFSETAYRWIPKTSDTVNLGRFVVKRRQHRVSVLVKTKVSYPLRSMPIPGARVQVEDVTPVLTANDSGIVHFAPFYRSGDAFKLRVGGPPDADFVARQINVYLKPRKRDTLLTVLLEPGARVTGCVRADGAPVDSARVFLDQGADTLVQTFTDHQGQYVLRNVPIRPDSQILCAVKTGYIGARRKAKVSSGSNSLDFALGTSSDLDLTRMFDFPIEVESLSRVNDSVFYLAGAFVRLPANPQFQLKDPAFRLRFIPGFGVVRDTLVNEQGVPYARPRALPYVDCDNDEVPVLVQGEFAATLLGQRVGFDSAAGNAVRGMVKVSATSFTDPNIVFTDASYSASEGGFRIAGVDTCGKRRVVIPALTASGNAPLDAPEGLEATTRWYGQLHYTLHGLGAAAVTRVSDIGPGQMIGDTLCARLRGDTLVLPTAVFWHLRNLTRPGRLNSLHVGTVKLRRTGYLPTLQANDTLDWDVEQWKLVCQRWTLSAQTGLRMKGYIQTDSVTGRIRVPFGNLYILPRDSIMRCKDFELTSLTFNGIIPVTTAPKAEVRFGWDEGYEHWGLTAMKPAEGGPAAFLKDLPGMTPDSLVIDNFYVLSGGPDYERVKFTLATGQKFKMQHLVELEPTMLIGAPGYAKIVGQVDLGIPLAPRAYGGARFKKDAQGDVTFEFLPVNVQWTVSGTTILLPGYPEEFWPQTLTGPRIGPRGMVSLPQFYARGKAFELSGSDSIFAFTIDLYHTSDSTWVKILDTHQRFYPARSDLSRFLDSVHGGTRRGENAMRAKSGAWDLFRFGGWARGWKGVVEDGIGNHLCFKVTGDVKAEDQKVKVNNVNGGEGQGQSSTEFAGMQLTYDFDKKQLVGVLEQRVDARGMTFDFYAEVLFGEPGWYFLGCGKVTGITLPMGAKGEVWLALLFGEHAMTTHIKSKFQEYSMSYDVRGQLPDNFPPSVCGFFFEGGVAVSWGANFEFNAGVVQAYINARLGVDLAFGMHFDSVGVNASAYLMGFAEIEAGLGAGFVVVCAGIEARVSAGIYAVGYIKSDGDWSAAEAAGEAGGFLRLRGSAYVGVGLPCWTEQGGCGGACVVSRADFDKYMEFSVSAPSDENVGFDDPDRR
jgi:hypothetical protein